MCDALRPEPIETRGVSGFVEELVVAVVNCRIYWVDHQRVEMALTRAHELLDALLQSSKKAELILRVADGYVIHDGRPLLGASLSAPRLIKPLLAVQIGGVLFQSGTSLDDLKRFVELLMGKLGEVSDHEEANLLLGRHGCSGVRAMGLFNASEGGGGGGGDDLGDGVENPDLQQVSVPVQMYQSLVQSLQTSSIKVSQGGSIDFQEVQTVVDDLVSNLETDAPTVLGLSQYERYDAFTFGHSIRVATLALDYTRRLTVDPELLNRVGLASLMHDVGKARVPFEVLHHNGPLDDDMRREMNKHPEHGAHILLDHEGVDGMAVAAAFGHHRMYGEGGYPTTIFETDFSLVTRVVKVCDVYEALTAVRPYKKAMTPARAFRVMFSMNDHFDPAILRGFVQTVGIFPTGSQILLTDDRVGTVLDQTGKLDRPVVQVDRDASGDDLHPQDRAVIDLSDEEAAKNCGVKELLRGSHLPADNLQTA